MSEAAPLDARTRRLGSAFDLMAAYDAASGFFMERAGLGVAGRGASMRVVVPGGPDQAARAASATAAALAVVRRGERGPPPVAVGALPFAGDVDAVLVVPRRTLRRTSPGEAWEMVVDRPDGSGTGAPDHPIGPAVPHDAFGEFQLHPEPPAVTYTAAVAEARERIRRGELRKVVLARTLVVAAGRELDPTRLLWRLRAVDPDCYAFGVAMPRGGTFVGASPELLVSRRGTEVRANPLAGSATRSGDAADDRLNADSLLSSSKDREEHELVVEVVADTLAPLCEALTFDREPVLHATANVWHLSTRFRGRLRVPAPSALELAAALHPTPAVCGTPREAARDAIAELEPFDRGPYGGPVGWVDADGDGEWAIALRCALIGDGGAARLFAGAGIVAGSEPESELDETERKFRAFLDSLRWG